MDRERAVADVQAAIDNAPKAPTGLLVNRHGWHGEVYVTRNEVFGDSSLPIFYVPLIDDDPAFGASGGALEDWRDGLREPCAELSYMTFAVSMALGATLLEPISAEGGTFILVGETTTFKTTTARVSQSVFGRAEPNDLASLDVTKRGREELCACRCDGVLVLDETARLDKSFSPADVQELAYCIVQRARKDSLRQRREKHFARERHLARLRFADLGAPLRNKEFSSAAPRSAWRRFRCSTRNSSAASSTARGYKAALAWRERSS